MYSDTTYKKYRIAKCILIYNNLINTLICSCVIHVILPLLILIPSLPPFCDTISVINIPQKCFCKWVNTYQLNISYPTVYVFLLFWILFILVYSILAGCVLCILPGSGINFLYLTWNFRRETCCSTFYGKHTFFGAVRELNWWRHCLALSVEIFYYFPLFDETLSNI